MNENILVLTEKLNVLLAEQQPQDIGSDMTSDFFQSLHIMSYLAAEVLN